MTFGKQVSRKLTPATLAVAVVCILGVAFNIYAALLNQDAWSVDFNQFYSASHLAGTGHLYDWEALRKIEMENGLLCPSGRLPVVLYGFKILGNLPYGVARRIWMAGSIAALVFFAAFWPGTRRWLVMVALAWSMPVALGLTFGQDISAWLMFFTAGLWLMEKKRPWNAGVVFALCICKFHLALGLPVMLVAQKRWKTLIAGAVAGSALIASCYLIEGPGWVHEYTKLAQEHFSTTPERMPDLFGLASWLPWATAAELAAAVAVVWLLWRACRGGTDLATAGAATVACGLLIGHHAYVSDCLLLIPISVLTIQRPGAPRWLKAWAFAMLSPAPVLLLVSNKPWLAQLLVVAFIVTATLFSSTRPLSLAAEPELAEGALTPPLPRA